jgi:aryl-alcohol dehydrogenase-like predicted oxidoreductase
MQRRQLGKTDMQVSPLGFGGSEIGYENVSEQVVSTLLNSALDAGLNVIDTAARFLSFHKMWTPSRNWQPGLVDTLSS